MMSLSCLRSEAPSRHWQRKIFGLNVNNAISLAFWSQQEPLANGFGLRLQVVKEDDNQEFICCDDKSGYEYRGE